MNGRRAGVCMLLLILASPGWASFQSRSHLLVVVGIGGEPYYEELFQRWARHMIDVATGPLGITRDRIIHLSPQQADGADGVSRKEDLLAAIAALENRSQPKDLILLLLLGHGTASGERALFNLPGPDISAQELAEALSELAGRTVVVVNTAPASAPFLEVLSGAERIVITATASAAEHFHTRFGGYFVTALGEEAADADKNQHVSLLEAFRYASREVQRAYELEGRMPTEHALLDDDGDGLGVREPRADRGDGASAARLFLAASALQTSVTGLSSSERRALEVEARALLDRLETLKRRKHVTEGVEYYEELETILVALALNRRALRDVDSP